MKDFLVCWTARGGIVLVVALCTLWGGAGSALASNKTAQVEVGFTGLPPPGFQNVLLNVQAVRLNRHTTAGPGASGWQIIPTPPGIGGGVQNAELQIDLNVSQDVPQLFNTAKVRPAKYQLVEILLDPNHPGTLIPNCPQTPAGPEGCISYPIALTNGSFITTTISGISPKNTTITPLVLQVQLMINKAPIVAGGAYQATLILKQSTAALGTVTGQIIKTGSSSGGTGKVIKLGVTAETIGTNTAIASSNVQTSGCPNKEPACYTLVLPAAGQFGTLYDLAVAGGRDSYSAARLPPLFAGGLINGPTFSITGQTVGNITGKVTAGCPPPNNAPLVGATLQLLVPPVSNRNLDCSTNLPTAAQCVTVASANTDVSGDFPLPGTLSTPPEFQNVPILPKGAAYAMEVTAPGYDPLLVKVKPSAGASKSGGGTCETMGSTSFSACNLTMTTAFITGTIPITPPPPGQTTFVQVFAEPTGTNNIQSSLPMPISVRNPNQQVRFTINVPSMISSFDLFASTIDKFQGVTDPYQGHNIVVFSPVAQPGRCQTSPPVVFDQTIDCVGHGSVVGQANSANLGASIALSKLDSMGTPVQITTAQIQNQSSISSTQNYGFCVPGDTYELQTIQLPQPVADVTPVIAPSPVPTGDPTQVTIPQAPVINGPSPSATPTPNITCPTTCSNPNGSCPGTCNTVIQPINIPAPPAAADAAPTP